MHKMITIDQKAKHEINSDEGGNELATLNYLSTGLRQLYMNVAAIERPLQEIDEKNGLRTMAFGNIPGLPKESIQLLPCFFHWYGTSLYNYARLVGFLSGLSTETFTRQDIEDPNNFDAITKVCNDYVSSIPELAAIKVWRDKVAGHFAITAPRKTRLTYDNPALLDFSVMYPVAFDNDRFRVGVFRLLRTDGAGDSHIGELPSWSLTEVHEALQPRYWDMA